MTILHEPPSPPYSAASPDNPQHKDLQTRVTEHLEGRDFLTESLAYHDKCNPAFTRVLQIRNSPTALIMRTRADRLAVHKTLPVEFLYEMKTSTGPNLAIEALPLAAHFAEARAFNVRCLYIFSHKTAGEGAFWCNEEDPGYLISAIHIPTNRWTDGQLLYYEALFDRELPGIPVFDRPTTYGSGDPYVLITPATMSKMRHWQELIDDELSSAEKRGH